ncbi:MAG: metallophosphoesterase [Pseudomonadota bacterium]
MKLVHISDIHIDANPILGSDPVENFKRCLAHVEHKHRDADRVVITGDLTHYGDQASYERLAELLEASSLQGNLNPRLLIGNHDDRETFAQVLAPERDPNGFIQWSEDTGASRFIYLDSVRDGSHEGQLCDDRLTWLSAELSEAESAAKPVFLFMHHNPITVGVPNADLIGLREQDAFHDVLKRHDGTVRHIFFGHCHYSLSGTLTPGAASIGLSAPRSTNHPCWPEISGRRDRMGYSERLERNYNVALIEPSSVVVHTIDFHHEESVEWLEIDETGWIDEGIAATG